MLASGSRSNPSRSDQASVRQGLSMDSPEAAQRRRSVSRTVSHCASDLRARAIRATSRAFADTTENGEIPGVCFFGDFLLAKQRKLLPLRHRRRWYSDQPREEHVWLVSVCGGSLPPYQVTTRTRFASPGYGLPQLSQRRRPTQRPLINRQVRWRRTRLARWSASTPCCSCR